MKVLKVSTDDQAKVTIELTDITKILVQHYYIYILAKFSLEQGTADFRTAAYTSNSRMHYSCILAD